MSFAPTALQRMTAERDALAADLAKVKEARQHELAYVAKTLKVMDKATAFDLRDEVRDMRGWVDSRQRFFALEAPVSTLCAVCDQIKELHPASHPWTARTTVETGAKSKGPIDCGPDPYPDLP